MDGSSSPISRKTHAAIGLVSALKKFLWTLHFEGNERSHISTGLLVASLDHGHSVLAIIEHSNGGLGASAKALSRIQFEALTKGIYVTDAARVSDGQLTKFRENGHLPKLPGLPGGKPGAHEPTLAELQDAANSILAAMVHNRAGTTISPALAIKELHGYIHSGNALLDVYGVGTSTVGYKPDETELTDILLSAVMNSAAAVAFQIGAHYPGTPPQQPAEIDQWSAKFLESLGLPPNAQT